MERSKTLVKNMEINQRNFRKEHLAIRNAMLPGEVAEKSSAIVKRLLQSEWYKDTKEILTGILETTQRLNTYNCTKALLEQL